MSSSAALAQVLAGHNDDDVAHAIGLYYSLRPHMQGPLLELLNAAAAPRYAGRIAKFLPGKKFGFIQCEEATNEFARDVFCSGDEMGQFGIGDDVTFSIVLNKDNHPQARLLQDSEGRMAATGSSEPAAKRQRMEPYEGMEPTSGWIQPGASHFPPPAPAPPATPPPPARAPPPPARAPSVAVVAESYVETEAPSEHSQRLVGSIKQFSAEKHFGFISSPTATESFGRDVFLSSMEIKDFAVGDCVSFDVVLNKNGHPQARNLDRRYVGNIKQFSTEKHFGFISSPAATESFGRDVFLSSMEIRHFTVGDCVSFDIVLNKNGHPQARYLEALMM